VPGAAPTGPALLPGGWVWPRAPLSVAGTRYPYGVTVTGPSSLTVALGRACRAYDAWAGLDDLAAGFGAARFAVYADDAATPLWRSAVLRDGEPAVRVHVPLAGARRVRLVVEPAPGGRGERGGRPRGGWAPAFGLRHGVLPHGLPGPVVADWARAAFSCS
jgi:hypothetical protein